jgi:cytochrome P450
VKNLYPLFWKKSSELVSLIKNDVSTTSKPSMGPTKGIVDIDDWSGRVGLDIIGQAGFGSEFNSLSNPHTPLNTYYRNSFVPDSKSAMIFFLSILTWPPLVRMLPLAKNRQVREGVAAINSYIGDLINQRKRGMYLNADNPDYFEKTGQKDIITSAMKSGAFSTENLVAQSKTLLGAGHET